MTIGRHYISQLVAIFLTTVLVIQLADSLPAAMWPSPHSSAISSTELFTQSLQLRSLMAQAIFLPMPAAALHQVRDVAAFHHTLSDHPFFAWTMGISVGYVAISAALAYTRGALQLKRGRHRDPQAPRPPSPSVFVYFPSLFYTSLGIVMNVLGWAAALFSAGIATIIVISNLRGDPQLNNPGARGGALIAGIIALVFIPMLRIQTRILRGRSESERKRIRIDVWRARSAFYQQDA